MSERLWQIKHAILELVDEAKKLVGEADAAKMSTHAPGVAAYLSVHKNLLCFVQHWPGAHDVPVTLRVVIEVKGERALR